MGGRQSGSLTFFEVGYLQANTRQIRGGQLKKHPVSGFFDNFPYEAALCDGDGADGDGRRVGQYRGQGRRGYRGGQWYKVVCMIVDKVAGRTCDSQSLATYIV